MTFNAKKLLRGADRSNTFKPVQISLDFHQAYEHTIIYLPCKLVNTNTSKVKLASHAKFFVHSVIECALNSAMVHDLSKMVIMVKHNSTLPKDGSATPN